MSEKNRQAKNGGAEAGSWCEKESHAEAGEEPDKVGWREDVLRVDCVGACYGTLPGVVYVRQPCYLTLPRLAFRSTSSTNYFDRYIN